MLTSWYSEPTNWPGFYGLECSVGQISWTSVFPKMGQKGLPLGVFQTFELLGQGLSGLWLLFSRSDASERLDMADCRSRTDTGRWERKPPTYPSLGTVCIASWDWFLTYSHLPHPPPPINTSFIPTFPSTSSSAFLGFVFFHSLCAFHSLGNHA